MDCNICHLILPGDYPNMDHAFPASTEEGFIRFCPECCPEVIDDYLCRDDHPKRYLVTWQTPGLAGTFNVACEKFVDLGIKILKRLPEKGRENLVITKIKLIEPQKYLKL